MVYLRITWCGPQGRQRWSLFGWLTLYRLSVGLDFNGTEASFVSSSNNWKLFLVKTWTVIFYSMSNCPESAWAALLPCCWPMRIEFSVRVPKASAPRTREVECELAIGDLKWSVLFFLYWQKSPRSIFEAVCQAEAFLICTSPFVLCDRHKRTWLWEGSRWRAVHAACLLHWPLRADITTCHVEILCLCVLASTIFTLAGQSVCPHAVKYLTLFPVLDVTGFNLHSRLRRSCPRQKLEGKGPVGVRYLFAGCIYSCRRHAAVARNSRVSSFVLKYCVFSVASYTCNSSLIE